MRGRQKTHWADDERAIAKIQQEVQKQREKAVFTKFLQEIAQEAAIVEIQREIGKRKREKAVFTKWLQKIAQGAITDQKIDRAWNEYQLARGLREAHYERERFRSQNRKLEKLIRDLEAVEKGEEISRSIEPVRNQASHDRRAIAALNTVLNFLPHARRPHSRVLYSLRTIS